MKTRFVMLACCWSLMAACAEDPGPLVAVSNVRILSPMPGSSAAVAYFSISNRGDTAIEVKRIESPQYEDVQMHETIIEDGIATMRMVPSFRVPPESSVEFAAGGKHVMLMRPATNVLPGSPVALEIQFDDSLLIVSATMQNRMPAE